MDDKFWLRYAANYEKDADQPAYYAYYAVNIYSLIAP